MSKLGRSSGSLSDKCQLSNNRPGTRSLFWVELLLRPSTTRRADFVLFFIRLYKAMFDIRTDVVTKVHHWSYCM
jgi:hypothetical protein